MTAYLITFRPEAESPKEGASLPELQRRARWPVSMAGPAVSSRCAAATAAVTPFRGTAPARGRERRLGPAGAEGVSRVHPRRGRAYADAALQRARLRRGGSDESRREHRKYCW